MKISKVDIKEVLDDQYLQLWQCWQETTCWQFEQKYSDLKFLEITNINHNFDTMLSVDIMLTPFSYHLDRRLTCWHKLTHTHTHCCHNFTMTRPGEGEAAWMRATNSIFQLLKVLVCLFVFYFATSGLVLVVVYVVFVSFSVTDL